MNTKRAYLDWQKRARSFNPGDLVSFFGTGEANAGIVTSVWPGIGMVDVEFPGGNQRIPVESLQNHTQINTLMQNSMQTKDLYPVSMARIAGIVSQEYLREKTALYWVAPDRKHKATRSELESGKYTCPQCKTEEGDCVPLRKKILQRDKGTNFHILVCPACTFAIQEQDIVNCGV
jgi:hypothetical protein